MFDAKRHMIKVQGGRQYLPVSARVLWFRGDHPDWTIETEAIVLDLERQVAIFRARILDAAGRLIATGTKCEDVSGFPDYIEKAETGAVGRALALCGYGTQFAASVGETSDAQYIVDRPLTPPAPVTREPQMRVSTVSAPTMPVTVQQDPAPRPAPDNSLVCPECDGPKTRSQRRCPDCEMANRRVAQHMGRAA